MNVQLEKRAQIRELAKKIAGEIVLSQNPGSTIRKWRNLLKISQVELASKLKISPSVISDYESNRRKSPGIKMIRKMVDAMLEIEEAKGGGFFKEFFVESNSIVNAILDIREFVEPVSIKKFCKLINAELVSRIYENKNLYGYTLIDSLAAILYLPPHELVKIYGSTTERALIFTHLTGGKSPMVAIKVTNFKPNLVVFHGIERVDEIALKIAEVEHIPVAVIKDGDVNKTMKALRENFI